MITKNTNRMTDGATVNVLDFGAAGDGVTDDTAAIQAAITYAVSVGSKVIVPFVATINIASGLTNLNQVLNTVVYSGFKFIINITTGTVISDQIFIEGKDLSWVEITSDDAEVTVDSSEIAIPNSNPVIVYNDDGTTTQSSTYGFISIFNEGIGPIISTLFTMNAETSNRLGFIVVNGSSLTVSSGAGIKNTGGDAALIYYNSTLTADGAIFDNSGSRGIWARWGSHVSFGGGSAINASWTAFQMHNSTGNCQAATLTGAGHYGIRARRSSKIEAQGAFVDNSAGHGVNANETSEINFRGGRARNCGDTDNDNAINCTEGSSINLLEAIVTSNTTATTIRAAHASTISAYLVKVENFGTGFNASVSQNSRIDLTDSKNNAGTAYNLTTINANVNLNSSTSNGYISATNLQGLLEGEGAVLTISGGVVTPTHKVHRLATEGGASTDDLDDILYENMADGDMITFLSSNPSDTITIKHATNGGRIRLGNGTDRIIGSGSDLFGYTLYKDSSNFFRGLS